MDGANNSAMAGAQAAASIYNGCIIIHQAGENYGMVVPHYNIGDGSRINLDHYGWPLRKQQGGGSALFPADRTQVAATRHHLHCRHYISSSTNNMAVRAGE